MAEKSSAQCHKTRSYRRRFFATKCKHEGFLGMLSKNYELAISGEEHESRSALVGNRNDPEETEIVRCPLEIEEAILNRRAVAAVDASVEDVCVAACWTITNLNNEPRIEGNITSSDSTDGLIPEAE